MGDKPHKTGPEALEELRSLSVDIRLHLHGLLERHIEGCFILATLVVLIVFLISGFPDSIHGRSFFVQLSWIVFIFFAVTWSVRSVLDIRKEVIQSLSADELRKGQSYARYCEGGWFMRTIGGLIIGAVVLLACVWLL